MFPQIKLHQQDRQHPCTEKTKKEPDHASLSREWDCGIEENLLQSRNVKSTISKGKFLCPRPGSTCEMENG